ncbi:MAG: type II toxin-antitoxin system RelE/ParE family toxin [Collinsella sp.]|nr:type II toxin-antitoxin system RelE/ParE family toxin [Collinsella sp.]
MACKAEILPTAKQELRQIISYHVRALASPQAARALLDEFERQLELICKNPRMRPLSALPELAALGYRSTPVKSYIALYTIQGERVIVSHIFHQSQDYAALI